MNSPQEGAGPSKISPANEPHAVHHPQRAARFDRKMMAVTFAGFCTFIDLYAPQSILPLLRHVFHTSEAQISLTVTVTTLAVALSAPWMGLLSDRIGRRRVIVGSVLALTIPTLLTATARTLPMVLVWRFLQGIAMPGMFAVTMAYISEEWPEKGAGEVMARYVTGTVFGGFSGRFLSGMIAAHFDWRISFLILGSITGLGSLVLWRWLPPSRNFHPMKDSAESMRAMLRHLRNPLLLATYAVGFNVLFSLVGTFTYIGFYLSDAPFRLSTAALGSLFLVYLLGMVVTPLSGRYIDQLGHRVMLVTGVAISAAGVLLTLSHNLPLVVLGLAFTSSGVFICQSTASSFVGTAADGARSSATGLYVSFYYIGGSVGAAVPGLFWAIGGWPACVALIVSVQVTTAAMALHFWQPHSVNPPEVITR